MPVEAKVVDDECKLYAMVTASSIANDDDLPGIFVDLDEALDILKERLTFDGVLAHALCLQVAGIEPELGAFEGASIGDELHDPWTSYCPAFWTKIVSTPSLEPELAKFLDKFRSLLKYANETLPFPMSEGDETQFGEPILAHLALTNPRFIPNYLELLKLWDMDHEVEISGAILEILENNPSDINAQALREYCINTFPGTDLASQL